ncbi:MAG: sulfatase-like hydrolase/transferase [Armatimonadota bacterium]
MLRTIPFHPLLAALAPVLLLLSANLREAPPSTALRAAGISLLCAAVIWAVASLVLRSISRGAPVATVVIFFLTSILAIMRMVVSAFGLEGTGKYIAGGVTALLLLAFLILIIRVFVATRDLHAINQSLNVIAFFIIIVPAVNVIRASLESAPKGVSMVSPPPIESAERRRQPDVYYIIPDGYAQADVLEDLYDYDNNDFLVALEETGFTISDASRSNYCQTALSLLSSLNMSYLASIETFDRKDALAALQDNAVMSTFNKAGYTTVAHNSGYTFGEITSADVHNSPGVNEFEQAVARTLFGSGWFFVRDRIGLDDVDRYEWTRLTLSKLGTERRREEPVFVMAHVLAPHPPFVFDSDGTSHPPRDERMQDGSHRIPQTTTAEQYRADYVRQLQGLNRHLLEAVRRIRDAASEPCIIIIQGDHGPGSQLHWEDAEATNMRERLAILNACLVPEKVSAQLYDQISPVNTFRLVLSYCLDTEIPLLEDRSYFSLWSRPYDFIDVTERVGRSSASDDRLN